MKKLKQAYLIIALCVVFPSLVLGQKYKMPEYSTFKLENGLTVYLMERHAVPVISVSTIIAAGAIDDGNQAGLADLTATALKHGTKSLQKFS